MSTKVTSEMAANVWRVLVREGDAVESGMEIVILESMKMEIPVTSSVAGTVSKLNVQEGDGIDEGDLIAVVE